MHRGGVTGGTHAHGVWLEPGQGLVGVWMEPGQGLVRAWMEPVSALLTCRHAVFAGTAMERPERRRRYGNAATLGQPVASVLGRVGGMVVWATMPQPTRAL